jgi:hypothetical protein
VIPQPGYCAQPCQLSSARRPQPCTARLAAGKVATLAEGHPILQAQRHINDLLAGRNTHLALYGRRPPTPPRILGDIHLMARWIISAVKNDALAQHLPPVLAAEASSRRAAPLAIAGARRSAVPSVETAAAGIVIALKVLTESSVSSAVHLLGDLMSEVDSGVDVYGAPIPKSLRLSPVARSVHDAAHASAKIQRRTLHRLAHAASRTSSAAAPSARRWIR